MTDKVYNILKYCALIAIPAIGTFYTTIASLWGWSCITCQDFPALAES